MYENICNIFGHKNINIFSEREAKISAKMSRSAKKRAGTSARDTILECNKEIWAGRFLFLYTRVDRKSEIQVRKIINFTLG